MRFFFCVDNNFKLWIKYFLVRFNVDKTLKYNGQKQKLFVDGDTDKYTVEKTGYSNYTKPFEDGVTEGKYANGSYAAMFVLKDKEHYVWSDNGKSDDKKTTVRMICTPKVDTFGGAYFYGKERAKI